MLTDKHVQHTNRHCWKQYHPHCIGGNHNLVRCGSIIWNFGNFHAQTIWHIRNLLTPDLALTLACSLILLRLDYCNAVLYGAPAGSIQMLQRVQNTAARIVLQAPRRSPSQPLLEQLHWLTVRQRIDYKLAVLTHKIPATSTPSYQATSLSPQRSHQTSGIYTWTPFIYHAATSLHRPTTRTHFADRAFRCCAPSVWNSLDSETLHCGSLSGFKRKTLLFHRTFSLHLHAFIYCVP